MSHPAESSYIRRAILGFPETESGWTSRSLALQKEREPQGEDPYEKITSFYAGSSYGLETVGTLLKAQREKLEQIVNKLKTGQLADGEFEAFFRQGLYNEAMYLVLQPSDPERPGEPPASLGESEADQRVWKNHQPAALQRTITELRKIRETLTEANYPGAPHEAYKAMVDEKIQHAMAMLELGKPEFTALQMSPENWGIFLQRTPDGHLKYYDKAVQMLEDGKNIEKKTVKIVDAMARFNINDLERAALIEAGKIDHDELVRKGEKTGDSPEFDQITEFTPGQGKLFFEIILHRMGLAADGWTVRYSEASGINVASQDKVILFPRKRKLQGTNVSQLYPHEIVHATRGANGSKQPFKIAQTGYPGYLETEEGFAVASEMIMGQEAGSDRQSLLAARYVAIDMALQTEAQQQTDGTSKTVAKYSATEILNALIYTYGIKPENASDVVWRILRGTSLQRHVVPVTVQGPDKQMRIEEIPEVYVKDSVYFSGIQIVLETLLELIPVRNDNDPYKEFLSHLKEFRPMYLQVIGMMFDAQKNNSHPDEMSYPDLGQTDLENLGQDGFDGLFGLMELFMLGKFTLDELKNPKTKILPAQYHLADMFKQPTTGPYSLPKLAAEWTESSNS